MAGILFEDIFDVKDIDPDGKKFDRGVLNNLIYEKLKQIRKYISIAIVKLVIVSGWLVVLNIQHLF